MIYMTNWGICTLNITILLETAIVILKYVGVGVPDKLMTGKYSVTWKLSFILIHYFSKLASLLHFLHCCSFHHFVILDNALWGFWGPSYLLQSLCTWIAGKILNYMYLCKYFNINIITYHHYSGPVCCHWSVCLKQTVALWKDMDMSPFWCYLCYIQCDLLGCWWTGSLGLVNIVWRRLFSVIFSNCRKSLCVPCDWLGKWPWQCYGHSGNRSGSLSTDSHIFLGSEPV